MHYTLRTKKAPRPTFEKCFKKAKSKKIKLRSKNMKIHVLILNTQIRRNPIFKKKNHFRMNIKRLHLPVSFLSPALKLLKFGNNSVAISTHPDCLVSLFLYASDVISHKVGLLETSAMTRSVTMFMLIEACTASRPPATVTRTTLN